MEVTLRVMKTRNFIFQQWDINPNRILIADNKELRNRDIRDRTQQGMG